MKQMRAWVLRLAGLFSSGRREQEFAAEIESHLQMHIDDNLRSGMTPEAARREALIKLGGAEQTTQACREAATVPLLEHLSQDLRFAFRQLGKNLGFAVTAVVILALGICASVAIFAFVDAALIKPLPYRDPNRLVGVTESVAIMPHANLSYFDYLDWKRDNDVFSSLDVWTPSGYMFGSQQGTALVPGIRVSDGFFRTLGVAPLLGRDFYPGEDLPSAPHTVMLSYAAWQNRFGARGDVLGQTVQLSGVAYTIIGVLPREFQFAPRGRAEFWTSLHASESGSCEQRRSCHDLDGVARLKDGVTVAAAQAEMRSIAAQLEKQYPDSNRGQSASVLPLSEVIVGDIRPILLLLLAGAGLLLVIACINVSNLLLVRCESRRHEVAVRGALGASPARMLSQFLTEAALLVFSGTLLGLAAAFGAIRVLLKLIPSEMLAGMPYLQDLGLNSRVLLFAAIIATGMTALLALTPVLRLSFSNLRTGLTEGGRGSAGVVWHRLGGKLVVFELATAVVLLVGAGLLGKSFYRLLHVELGFQPEHLATFVVTAPAISYHTDAQQAALGRSILSRLESLPGVGSVSLANRLPVTGNGNTIWFRIVGHPYHGEHNEVNERDVSSDYFKTLQAPLLQGRYFSEDEDASRPNVVVINQTLAKRYFPGEDPIGKKIGDTDLSQKSLAEIVGIVDDIKEGQLDSEIWPAIYYPFNQSPDSYFSVVVRYHPG